MKNRFLSKVSGRVKFLPLLLFPLLPLNAQTSTSSYQPGVTPEGMVYFLPKTAVRIVVQIEKTTYTPGEFCKYADRYLRLKDVASESSVSYRITNLRVEPIAMADTTKGFSVKFDPKSVASNIALSDDGKSFSLIQVEGNAPDGRKILVADSEFDFNVFRGQNNISI